MTTPPLSLEVTLDVSEEITSETGDHDTPMSHEVTLEASEDMTSEALPREKLETKNERLGAKNERLGAKNETQKKNVSHDHSIFGGRYTTLRVIGEGGMGTVYEAFDLSLGRRVAIKVLRGNLSNTVHHQDHSARLLREARMLAAVNHPNVLNVYDVGISNEQVFITVQYIEGVTLRTWIKEERPSWQEILKVYLQIGDGLFATHQRGLVHRDLKPDNILISHDSQPKLVDFGLACTTGEQILSDEDQKMIEEISGEQLLHSMVTRAGVVMGTPAYMSPEQYLGHQVDARADQFSFAVALFESIYKIRPFAGDSLLQLKNAVCEGHIEVSPTVGIPPKLYEVLSRALSVDPSHRYSSLKHFLTALQHASRPSITRAQFFWGLGVMFVLGFGLSQWIIPSAYSLIFPSSPKDQLQQLKKAELAVEREMLSEVRALNMDCKKDIKNCRKLAEYLNSCCISPLFGEVIKNKYEMFKTGGRDVVESLLSLCEATESSKSNSLCAVAAFSYTLSFHNYTFAEGDMIPRYIKIMKRGCLLGDITACMKISEIYADGYYDDDPIYPTPVNELKLIELLGASCDQGVGVACWFLAEDLLTSLHFKKTKKTKKIVKRNLRALSYIELGCQHGWKLACVLGYFIYADQLVTKCSKTLQAHMSHLSLNDLIDKKSTWSDLHKFCARFQKYRDQTKALKLIDLGCEPPTPHDHPDISHQQLQLQRLSCKLQLDQGQD